MTPKRKTCMICQPHGIGDVLFIQKIVRHFADHGFHVVVPILDTLSWMRYYVIPDEHIEYPLISTRGGAFSGNFKYADLFLSMHAASSTTSDPQNKIFSSPVAYNGGDEETGFIFLALGASYQWLNDKMMSSKYRFVGLDHKDWARHVHLKRRTNVERELYYDVLGLKDDSRYTLVNEQCSTKRIPLPVPGNTVQMQQFEGFTLFDWSLVVEKAAQIVTVDTSLVLLTEILGEQKPLTMISRYDPPNFETVQDILSLDWKLVPTADQLNVAPVL